MKFKSKNSSDFFSELTHKVEGYISAKGGNRFGNKSVFIKGLLLVCLYIGCYTVLLTLHNHLFLSVVTLLLMGFTAVMIVFNIVHDASHNVLFKNPSYNKIAVYLGDLAGMNSYIWNIRHNIQHHTFTNVVGGDILLDSVPLIRISPYQKKYPFQKYQALYAPFLYAVYSIFWIFVLDFSFFMRKEMGNIKNIRHGRSAWLKLFLFKLFYVTYMLLIPAGLFSIPVAHVIAGFFIYHAAAGLLLSAVVVLGHCVEDVQYIEPDANGIIHNSWMQHEWDTTSDCATNSRLLHWISGGLNTHLAHHLYPRICHCHYYDITRIIKEHCKEKEVRYPHHHFTDAIISHFRFLQKQAIA